MAGPAAQPMRKVITREDQPLVGLPSIDGSDSTVEYFTSIDELDQAVSRDRRGIEIALRAIGAWEHLDAEPGPDMLDELDRLRHESAPTPPLGL